MSNYHDNNDVGEFNRWQTPWQTHQKLTSALASVSFNFLSEARRILRELLLQKALES